MAKCKNPAPKVQNGRNKMNTQKCCFRWRYIIQPTLF